MSAFKAETWEGKHSLSDNAYDRISAMIVHLIIGISNRFNGDVDMVL